MAIDVSSFIGDYPFRRLEPATPDLLLSEMDRLGIDESWVGHLPSFLYRDPGPGNTVLEKTLGPHRDRLVPVPTVHAGLPRWEEELNRAVAFGAPAVRVYPQYHGLAPDGPEMRVLVAAAAAARLVVVLTVRFEDARQRHPNDTAPEFPPWAVRSLVRSDPDVKLVVTHAGRSFVEEVHFGSTPEEAARVLWDFSWIWGPPDDHLALLLATIGVERFTLGTGIPLRISDGPFAKLDLLDLEPTQRRALLGANLEHWLGA